MREHSDDDWHKYRMKPTEPGRFRFRPRVGVIVSLLVFLSVANRDDGGSIIIRALGLTGLFGSLAISDRRRRQPGESMSAWKFRNTLFAAFCALVVLAFIVGFIYDRWFR